LLNIFRFVGLIGWTFLILRRIALGMVMDDEELFWGYVEIFGIVREISR
jgi:hypothetical protein